MLGAAAQRFPLSLPLALEGSTLAVPISATDTDGDDIAFTDTDLPSFATLTDFGDGTGQLDIEPNPAVYDSPSR